MDRNEMMDVARRIARAPNNEARICELTSLASDAALSRLGLQHRSSMLGTAMTVTGALVIGAAIGAGAALLFAPTSGKELQQKLRRQAKRVSRDVKKAQSEVEERVSDVRDSISSFGSSEPSRRSGPRA